MAESRIPVDLFNPGQVFACVGFMEAAEILIGGVEGGFDWSEPSATRFVLRAAGTADPVREVLAFLAEAKVAAIEPAVDHSDASNEQRGFEESDDTGHEDENDLSDQTAAEKRPVHTVTDRPTTIPSEIFPAPRPDKKLKALPVRFLGCDGKPIVDLGYWWDKSGRTDLKLYSGNRSALKIIRDMVSLIQSAWNADAEALTINPLDTLIAMGGSFNLDARGAWSALDAGYSPDAQKNQVKASPVVELLAAWGLEHSRPMKPDRQSYFIYAAWGEELPLLLARPLIGRAPLPFPTRTFGFMLAYSGKNKIVTFADEEKEG